MYGNRNLGEIRRQEEQAREGGRNDDDGLLAECIGMMCNACCSVIASAISSCCSAIASLCNGNNQDPHEVDEENHYTPPNAGTFASTPYVYYDRHTQTPEHSARPTAISVDKWIEDIQLLLQTNPGTINANNLYQEASQYYREQNYERATAYYWKAFICGDGRAAYDLCIIFKDQVESRETEELAAIMYHFSARQGVTNRSAGLKKEFKYTDERLEFSRKILDYLGRSKLFLKDKSFGNELLDYQISFFDQLTQENVQILGGESVLHEHSMSQFMGIDL